LVVSALAAAFCAGWGMRTRTEDKDSLRWIPPEERRASLIPLVHTADGNLSLDSGSESKRRSYKPDLKPYETLDEVRRAIKENFVNTNVNETELTYGAIRGMLRSLGDRFTRFLTPEDYDEFQIKTGGEWTGIGARIDLKDEYNGSSAAKPFGASRPIIVEAVEGGPAAKAGLKKDDVILSVDGHNTADMSPDAVADYIKGEQGTNVTLKIERRIGDQKGPLNDRSFKSFDITLKREVIEIHPVKMEWLQDRIAWLRLDEFNKKSDAEITKALQELEKGPDGKGPARGLIFDMRDNPGGLLDVAVDVGSHFIASGPIVYTRERNGSERSLNAERDRFMNLKMPIIVLIDQGSASAAEIVTGALKDKNLATVVGETSYGKASVQVLVELKNGGALVITTAKYLTPGKHDISDKGIAPDVPVKASPEDERDGRGAQLQKAVALIEEKTTNTTTVAAKPQ
jgi:carboxyl-terminal processing protease